MRECYEIPEIAWLYLEVSARPNVWNIASIVVEEDYQGLGAGSALMNLACRDADARGIELWLVPQPLNENRLGDLIRFYERHGFEKLGGSGYYRRMPKKENYVNA